MNPEETMVDFDDDQEAEEELPEEIVEEEDESEESLDSLTEGEEEAEPTEEEPEQPEAQGTSEPGWFKKRWNKEVGKLSNQIRNEVRAEYEAQFAPLRERLLEMDAKELVQSGQVKDLETAKELVRYRQGQPAQPKQQAAPKEPQPRNDQGQFAPRRDPATSARIDMLEHQVQRIKDSGGPDVISAFQNDEDIKQAVISGDMDFYDVAEHLKQKASKRPPSPMRTPNGASSVNPNAIESMSDEQFERMERNIKEKGARYTLR